MKSNMSSSRISKILCSFIRVYQHTLSPDHGVLKVFFPRGVCRYEQTCSEYTYHAIQQFGAQGLWLGAKRILSCL